MSFQDFANSLWSELQLTNKPLPRQKPTAKTFSDTPLPGESDEIKSNKLLTEIGLYIG